MAKAERGAALGEDLFWFGEKMRHGYEGVAPNPEAALNLYKAAAASGFPRAYLRIGEMYERGIGTAVCRSDRRAGISRGDASVG